ncbi:hypothetical protein HYFRA_00003385 [Hymenoscyphus fraxineus]|uniref:Uncharacterized protein n=1 Tax=Hymenoscyphus fraxineus TaxID=746836 RepID=A0A9N9KS81_9HELO|nr:hypothetical protein HYFRA_00003385 [Hymenoscyphus fraxineus]
MKPLAAGQASCNAIDFRSPSTRELYGIKTHHPSSMRPVIAPTSSLTEHSAKSTISIHAVAAINAWHGIASFLLPRARFDS